MIKLKDVAKTYSLGMQPVHALRGIDLHIREGEYEGLAKKIEHRDWTPDFGPVKFNPRCGATVIGARKFLVAYNVNLNTMDKRLATGSCSM